MSKRNFYPGIWSTSVFTSIPLEQFESIKKENKAILIRERESKKLSNFALFGFLK